MKKELLNYFNRTNNLKFGQNGEAFIEDGINVRKTNQRLSGINRYNIFAYLMGDDLMVVKTGFSEDWSAENIMEVISGEYFNSIGIPSVEAYPIKIMQEDPVTKNTEMFTALATHNLNCLKDIDIEIAINVMCDNKDIFLDHKLAGSNILISQDCKKAFLEIMTEDCYNDWANLFLADRLGTYKDRHLRNYFFYRKSPEEKWQGIIVIDNEQSKIVDIINDRKLLNHGYHYLINDKYKTTTPFQDYNLTIHAQYINCINLLLNRGVLGDSQIQLIKKALEYPYADKLKRKCERYGLDGSRMYDLSARLWEYNRENLEL